MPTSRYITYVLPILSHTFVSSLPLSAASSETVIADPTSASFWLKMLLILLLVLTGGLFAGLTIGLMSIDANNLEVLKHSDDPVKRYHAEKIEPIRKDGHLLLCTLLLGNTVINESLPIVFDSVFEGGVLPIVISTALIVIFGEIIPQAVCTRFGLRIGSSLAWLVRIMIILFWPLAYPISRVLSYVMGDQEGTIYRRAELKELVALHSRNALGHLNDDEVKIIGGVLDLKSKTAASVMTPLNNVYALSLDTVITKDVYREIVERGHSRMPVYEGEITNIVGMLIVKHLLMHDNDVQLSVRSLALASMPVVEKDMNLFSLLNHFQTGRSHMTLVCDEDPSLEDAMARHKFIGIVTLEDVIEEIIGEEIIDETDVYVDMASKLRVQRLHEASEASPLLVSDRLVSATPVADDPKPFISRRFAAKMKHQERLVYQAGGGIQQIPRKAQLDTQDVSEVRLVVQPQLIVWDYESDDENEEESIKSKRSATSSESGESRKKGIFRLFRRSSNTMDSAHSSMDQLTMGKSRAINSDSASIGMTADDRKKTSP